ncbi:MAG: cytochrome b [Rhizomicrobium sp.]|jgi:cytochrome b561
MPQASNTEIRYGNVAMALHWLIALLAIGNLCSGLTFAQLMSHDNPWRFTIIQTHKSIGLTILVLSVIRLIWRLMNRVPPLPLEMSAPLKFVARLTHYLFYFLIIAIPLAGWLLVSASPTGIPTMYFGLFPWPNLPFFDGLTRPERAHYTHTFAAAHSYMAFLTIALVLLHVAAALYHQFIRRDNVLRRMWFGTQVRSVPR